MFLAVFDGNVLELRVLLLLRRGENQRWVGCCILGLVFADSFEKGSDVVNGYLDNFHRRWTFPIRGLGRTCKVT